MTADAGDPLGMLSPDATAEDMVSDAEIIGDGDGSNPDEHPMIVPVRAYYFTRAEDTLRSISAQFLHTAKRWQELRSLNAASPGVAAVGPDTLLPAGTALALPGDPVPWGNPDPVYLWTLAEKFLFTAWGREPTPEEVVPFWRGLTSGTQLEAGAPPAGPEYLAAPTEPPPPEIAREPAPTPTEPPAPSDFWSPPPPLPGMEPSPAPADFQPPPPATPPAIRIPRTPLTRTTTRRPPTAGRIRIPRTPNPPTTTPTRIRIPRTPITRTTSPTRIRIPRTPNPRTTSPTRIRIARTPNHTNHHPRHPHTNRPYPQPTNHQSHPHTNPPYPQPTNHHPRQPHTNHQPHTNPPYPPHTNHQSRPHTNHQSHPHTNPPYPQPTNHQSHPHTNPPYPQPTDHHPRQPHTNHQPHTNRPYPPHTNHQSRPHTNHQSHPHTNPPYPQPHEPPVPPAYESPVLPTHQPPPAYESPVVPTHQPPPPPYEPPPAPPTPGLPDFGPIEPEVPYVEAEAPRMPSFMPSLTGAESAAPAPEAEVVAASNRSLAGTAVGDAMMLWQLSRIPPPDGGDRPDALDPMEESLRQSARVDTLNLIEAAMRHLRAVTVGRLREKPAVLAVRVGTYGFEVLLNRPVQAPEGWQAASGGYVLELPRGVAAEDLDAAGQGPTLCPALVPVGDTLEGPLLLNIEEIGCLIVSGPGSPSVNLLNAVVGTLGSSPLAADIRIITVGTRHPGGPPRLGAGPLHQLRLPAAGGTPLRRPHRQRRLPRRPGCGPRQRPAHPAGRPGGHHARIAPRPHRGHLLGGGPVAVAHPRRRDHHRRRASHRLHDGRSPGDGTSNVPTVERGLRPLAVCSPEVLNEVPDPSSPAPARVPARPRILKLPRGRTLALGGALTVLCLVAAACGGGDSGGTAQTQTAAPRPWPRNPPPPATSWPPGPAPASPPRAATPRRSRATTPATRPAVPTPSSSPTWAPNWPIWTPSDSRPSSWRSPASSSTPTSNEVNFNGGINGRCVEFVPHLWSLADPVGSFTQICTDMLTQKPIFYMSLRLSDPVVQCATIGGQIPTIGLYAFAPASTFAQTGDRLYLDDGSVEHLLSASLDVALSSGVIGADDHLGLLHGISEMAESVAIIERFGFDIAAVAHVPAEYANLQLLLEEKRVRLLEGDLTDDERAEAQRNLAALPPELVDLFGQMEQFFLDAANRFKDAGVTAVAATADWSDMRRIHPGRGVGRLDPDMGRQRHPARDDRPGRCAQAAGREPGPGQQPESRRRRRSPISTRDASPCATPPRRHPRSPTGSTPTPGRS